MADSNKKLLYLLSKIILFISAILMSYLILLWFCLYYGSSNGYVAAQIDKIELLKTTSSPRLIFIGGSNLAFGLDSVKVSHHFGMPVVNMGLDAGFGLKYILNSTKPFLKKNDIVVVAAEYELFVGELFDDPPELLKLAAVTHDFSLVRSVKFSRILKSNHIIFGWSNRPPPPQYSRDGFNRYGDMVAHLTMEDEAVKRGNILMDTSLNFHAIEYLADFIIYCKKRGIKSFYIFPCLGRSNYKKNKKVISKIAVALNKANPNMVLGSPTDFIYDYKYLFNTIYHLNAEGRKLRTLKMIKILDKVIKGRGKFN